eukprot:310834_1
MNLAQDETARKNESCKSYVTTQFKTVPIGARRNIYIDVTLIKQWEKIITERFKDEMMFYYYLDYFTAITMCEGNAKQYDNKTDNKFDFAIINYELHDKYKNELYGIIKLSDNNCDKKHKYKLTLLATKDEIFKLYNIDSIDLPKALKIRIQSKILKTNEIKLCLSQLTESNINWKKLGIHKSKSKHYKHTKSSVKLTNALMTKYFQNSVINMKPTVIPILVVDKQNDRYSIEYVTIINIAHCKCNIGVSFAYNESNNKIIPTSIYLDNKTIHSKCKLLGLNSDMDKMADFYIKKLKWTDKKLSVDENIMHNEFDNSWSKYYWLNEV